ncbi:MAG: L-rhamnose/proton symporter RhaT [Acidobacteria bacterium]|nr:L-rhamnose/proton symporter RhaT [Acidobacteriota bacterium]MBW4046216.1 L-rhamnose/proton symporter RhaT [Acidobacteriota bacterium]
MGPNPFIGVVFHWIGGLASASCYLPFRGIRRWSWEIYWLLQGVFSWIIAPLFFAGLLVPGLFSVLHAAPASSLFYAWFWGLLWGVGGLTFGLSVRYLGIALGYPIALGLCTAFGTLMPPIFSGQMGAIAHSTSGQVILLGIGVCMAAIVVSGAAGKSKESELTAEEKQATVEEFSYPKGLAVAIFAGIMSACFAYGLAAGKPIAEIARVRLAANGRADLWQNLPVLVVVLWGGFMTNFLWCAWLIMKNRSVAQYAGEAADGGSPVQGRALLMNYFMAAVAGVTWYFQFFFYSIGQTKMGKYDFSSWTLHMASIILFSTIWGIMLKEWRGTSSRTRWLVGFGIFLLIASTVIVGYGNYLKVGEDSAKPVATSFLRGTPARY